MKGSQTAFQWQAIAGLAYSISPDVDLFGEYRYRSNETDANFGSSFTQIRPLHVNNVAENVAMLGLRWYLTPAAAASPAAAAAASPAASAASASAAASPAAAGEDVHRLLRLR